MNFEEWYKTMPKLTESELRISVISWDKCKEEVLKILKEKSETLIDNSGQDYIEMDLNVLKEIEKL